MTANPYQRLHDEICGFGVIQPFLDDESVEEIWINSPDEIFIARNGESELTGLHLSAEAINSLLERMLKPSAVAWTFPPRLLMHPCRMAPACTR